MLEEATILDLQEKMGGGRPGRGELTVRQVTEWYLARIAAIDKSGPAVNAVIELNPDALAIADALDAERATKGPRGPLHGIPVVLKDNIDTADRMMTTAGSLALEGSIPAQDATVAAKLRAAGAVILGKANLSEWANFRGNHSSSGWSSRGGQTRSPYALDRNPSGSSSGSAVAVAANQCAVAVGTETDGSIVSPAQTNAIVGLKPTVGLVSRAGIVPIAHSQDTAGPMARTVVDAAILLSALAGPDPRDAVTAPVRGKFHADYTYFLDVDGVRGARIGVARNFFGYNAAVDRVMEESLAALRDLGAVLVDPANVETAKNLEEPEMAVLLYEFKADLDAYLGALGPAAPRHSMVEVIDFNEHNRERVMPFFGQELMMQAQGKGPLSDEAYAKALRTSRRLSRSLGIDRTLRRHALDAIVAPSGGPAWLTDHLLGDHYTGGSSSPAAVAGYPDITVPAGFVQGLPVGISFFSGAYREPLLIRLAFAFEQATRVRRPPQFLPTITI